MQAAQVRNKVRVRGMGGKAHSSSPCTVEVLNSLLTLNFANPATVRGEEWLLFLLIVAARVARHH